MFDPIREEALDGDQLRALTLAAAGKLRIRRPTANDAERQLASKGLIRAAGLRWSLTRYGRVCCAALAAAFAEAA